MKTSTTTQNSAPPDRLLRLPAVLQLTGLARSSLYRAITEPARKGGGFPRPAKLGRVSAWPESEVRDWIEGRKAERHTG